MGRPLRARPLSAPRGRRLLPSRRTTAKPGMICATYPTARGALPRRSDFPKGAHGGRTPVGRRSECRRHGAYRWDDHCLSCCWLSRTCWRPSATAWLSHGWRGGPGEHRRYPFGAGRARPVPKSGGTEGSRRSRHRGRRVKTAYHCHQAARRSAVRCSATARPRSASSRARRSDSSCCRTQASSARRWSDSPTAAAVRPRSAFTASRHPSAWSMAGCCVAVGGGPGEPPGGAGWRRLSHARRRAWRSPSDSTHNEPPAAAGIT